VGGLPPLWCWVLATEAHTFRKWAAGSNLDAEMENAANLCVVLFHLFETALVRDFRFQHAGEFLFIFKIFKRIF